MPNRQHRYDGSFLPPLGFVRVALAIDCAEPESPADRFLAEAADLLPLAQKTQQTSLSEALQYAVLLEIPGRRPPPIDRRSA